MNKSCGCNTFGIPESFLTKTHNGRINFKVFFVCSEIMKTFN